MPITRVPVVHKFGIISHCQRLELQERLAKKILEQGAKTTPTSERKNDYSINEEFITKLNSSEPSCPERMELEEKANKMLLRAKRKAGLRDGGIGNHVVLQEAWKDLSLLATCESRSLQEGALNCLYMSLYNSPISKTHVKSLLQLAERSIHWLRESAMSQPYLRTGEVKLLKVAHLVFIRLYYHHLAADIQDLHMERTQLIDVLQGFQEHQDIYRPFPGSLLLVRVIVQVGTVLRIGLEKDLYMIAKQNKSSETYDRSSWKQGVSLVPQQSSNCDQLSETEAENHHQGTLIKSDAGEQDVSGLQQGLASSLHFENGLVGTKAAKEVDEDKNGYSTDESVFHEVKSNEEDERMVISIPDIHDTSPTFWHSLDLWRIVTHSDETCHEAIKELVQCSIEFHKEPMLESILAMRTLAEVSKLNTYALLIFQCIARRGIFIMDIDDVWNVDPSTTSLAQYNIQHMSTDLSLQNDDLLIEYTPSILDNLRNFLNPKLVESNNGLRQSEQRASLSTNENRTIASQHEVTTVVTSTVNEVLEEDKGESHDPLVKGHDDKMFKETRRSISEGSLADVSSLDSSQSRDELKTLSSKRRLRKKATNHHKGQYSSDESQDEFQNNDTNNHEPHPSMKRDYSMKDSSASLGSPLNAKGNRPGSSRTETRPNTSITERTKWSWELVLAYVRCLGDICIHGNKSQIQRDALMGCQGNEAGLQQMLNFQLANSTVNNSDWSWRVRHMAVQELIKICHHNNNSPNKDGLQNAAWSMLLSRHSEEQDRRVLEAYKIGRTEVNFEETNDILKKSGKSKVSLFSRIATNLAIIHLQPMRTDMVLPNTNFALKKGQSIGQRSQKGQKSEKIEKNTSKKVGRLSLRNEIMVATSMQQKPSSYEKRSWLNVQDVVEEQWRKELAEEHERIEAEKQKEIDREIELLKNTVIRSPLNERV